MAHTTSYQYDGLGRTIAVTDALGNATTFTYDGLGNRLSVTNPEGESTSYSYDGLNRLVGVSNPLSFATLYQYDGLGNRISMTDAEGVQTCYGYDALDRLISVTENCLATQGSSKQQNVTTFYAYDALGNRTIITNGLGYTSTFSYDALNRLTAEADPLGNTTRYAYDEVGNRSVLTDANGAVTSFTYGDALNHLTTIDYPNGQSDVTFTYDRAGNRLTMQDESGTTTYAYDGLYRLTESTNGNHQTTAYAYDAVGNRIELTDGEKRVSYTYDDANRLQRVANDSGLYSYDYDSANRLTELSYPNGITSQYEYDTAGQLIELTHSQEEQTYARYEYLFDGVGNRLAVTETVSAQEPVTSTFAHHSLTVSNISGLNVQESLSVTAPIITGEQQKAYFGYSAANAGDVNADGYDDLLVGAVGFGDEQHDEGAAYLYLGSDNGLSNSPAWTTESNQRNANLGWSLNAGDLNGDGYSDVVIGIPFVGNSGGRVELFYGGANGLSENPDWAYSSPEENRLLAYSVASAGDVNNDGYDDLLVGARGIATKQLGVVYLFYGSAW